MILFKNSNNGLENLINNRFVFQGDKPSSAAKLTEAGEAAEQAELPDNVIIKMAQMKARKEVYKEWGKDIMRKFEKQTDNLKQYLKLKNPDKITNPAVAYKHLKKLSRNMESEWKKEQLRIVKASGATGIVDVGNYTYEFYLNPAPCKPLNGKEQAYLIKMGKKMPESQRTAYINLFLDLQMKLTTEGEQAFRKAAKKAGVDMSQAESARVYEEDQMIARVAVQKAKRRLNR